MWQAPKPKKTRSGWSQRFSGYFFRLRLGRNIRAMTAQFAPRLNATSLHSRQGSCFSSKSARGRFMMGSEERYPNLFYGLRPKPRSAPPRDYLPTRPCTGHLSARQARMSERWIRRTLLASGILCCRSTCDAGSWPTAAQQRRARALVLCVLQSTAPIPSTGSLACSSA